MIDDKNFRDRLTLAREHARLNMSELARRLSLTPQAIHSWESGTNIPRRRRIEQVAQVLGVDARWLAFGEGTMITAKGLPSEKPTADIVQLLRPAGQGHRLAPPAVPLREVREAAVAWDQALDAALPEEMLAYRHAHPGAPWPDLSYMGPDLAAEIILVSERVPEARLHRAMVQLIIAGKLSTMTGVARRLMIVVADGSGEGAPIVPPRASWEAQMMGIEIAIAISPEDAAAQLMGTT